MPKVARSALVHYSAGQMFDLVADVKAYPQFLPWCGGSQVRPHPDGGVNASVDIVYRGIRARFTTRNLHRYPEQIRMDLVDGPFRTMAGMWQFVPLRAGACKVNFRLDYAFVSGLLSTAVAPVFDAIADTMVDSFAQRAEALYGCPD
jgi:ribosome-associated toxin RatA of RatAB toxin-antitoxin module